MSLTEFELIHKFFENHKSNRRDVLLGVGDDAALLQPPQNQLLVVSTDTLISNVHFPEKTLPQEIGYQALAVNLSDLAAMGAEPAWVMLALTLPQADEKWLTDFSQGFFQLIDHYGLQLVGGDTTRGSLAITVQVLGFVPPHQALKRQSAKVGDKIYVTGTLGDAGFLLKSSKIKCAQPRIEMGLALREIANSCIDVSDGLAADLQHILTASKVGAKVFIDELPLSDTLKKLPIQEIYSLALTAGDDYELCFTVPAEKEAVMLNQLKHLNCLVTCIGVIEEEKGLRLIQKNGQPFSLSTLGYQHFSRNSE